MSGAATGWVRLRRARASIRPTPRRGFKQVIALRRLVGADRGQIQFHLPVLFLAQAIVAVVVATALAGIYPARRAADMGTVREE